MGRFFSNIQIKSDLSKDELVKRLQNALPGYEICGNDEADITCRTTLSERYATFTRLEYNDDPDALLKDAEMLSTTLKTSVFTITVADSDFAELSLFTDGKQTDSVVVGDGESYGTDENPAEPELWQPLLKPETAFGELAAVWGKQEIFVEDALADSAPLFGIEPRFMLAEFEHLSDKDAVTLCFRKKASADRTEEKPDIVTVFDNVFEEALAPKGFRRVKKGVFVRVIGGEILQLIEYHNTSSGKKKSLTVCTKMCTVYEPTSKDPKRGYFFPTPYLCTMYSDRHPEKYIDETYNRMNNIPYDPNDEASMTRAARDALEYTAQIALPKYDRVTDLPSYLLILEKEIGGFIWVSKLEKCRDPKCLDSANDELLYVKTQYSGDFLETLRSEQDYNEMTAAVKARNFTPLEDPYPYCDEPYSKYKNDCIEGAARCRKILDQTLADSELCTLINAELERRRSENIKKLAKLGIEI